MPGILDQPTDYSGLLGYSVRGQLYPGEDSYFKSNPHVAGMASEAGDIVLNPYSAPDVDRGAVARNEAFRLMLRDRKVVPKFALTNEQKRAFAGTPYEKDEDALKATIAARIYSGDPSAKPTMEQVDWVMGLLNARHKP